MEFANSDAFEDLRRLIDKEESLIDKDFLVLYTKLVFSKKVDIEISKTATLIAKSTRNFINQILDMEKFYKLSFVNLTDTERIILTLTNDCFDELTKVIDGDVMRDKFNSQIHDNKFYNDNEDLKKQLDIYLIDTILTDNIMDSIDQRFQKRKNIMSTIIQHEILTNFINNKYKDVKNISEYEESLIKVLKETLRNTSLSTQTKVLLMSNQNVDDIVKEEGQKFRIPTRYNIFDFPFNGGFENGRLYTFTGVSGGGKAQNLTSKVLTPTGFVEMGSLKIGDKVTIPNGNTANITHIFPQGKIPVYKVTFSDGSFAKCSDEHLWTVQYRSKKNWRVLTLRELMNKGIVRKYEKHDGTNISLNAKQWKIKLIENTNFTNKDYDISPYIMGVLLGDGALKESSVRIIEPNIDYFIINKVESLLDKKYYLHKHSYEIDGYCPYYDIIQIDKTGKDGSTINI
jgi:hypothetical protein